MTFRVQERLANPSQMPPRPSLVVSAGAYLVAPLSLCPLGPRAPTTRWEAQVGKFVYTVHLVFVSESLEYIPYIEETARVPLAAAWRSSPQCTVYTRDFQKQETGCAVRLAELPDRIASPPAAR